MEGSDVPCKKYTVFKDAHPNHRIPAPIVLNKTQFCEAFFHVPKVLNWNTEMQCLHEDGCRVYDKSNKLHRNDPTKNPKLRQHKHVVCFVVLERGGDVIYKALYENCVKDKNHAEDYFYEDARCVKDKDITIHAEDFFDKDARKGELKKKLDGELSLGMASLGLENSSNGSNDSNDLKLDMYITSQPCHESTEEEGKSCTETLIQRLYEEELKPRSIKFVVKPTFIYKAYWTWWKDEKTKEEVENAYEGLRKLCEKEFQTDKGIQIQAMDEADWTFLRKLCPSVEQLFDGSTYEQSERKKLDESIRKFLGKIKKEVSPSRGSDPSSLRDSDPSSSRDSDPSPSSDSATRQEEDDRENEYKNLARNHLRVDNQKLKWKGTENELEKFLVLFFKDAGKISQENPKDTKVKARFRANDGSIFRWFHNKTLQCQGDNNKGQENKTKLLDLVTRLNA